MKWIPSDCRHGRSSAGCVVRIVASLAFAGSLGTASANPGEARRLLERGSHEEARNLYQELADASRLPGRRASLRLGEGLAAYRGGDFRGARAGYSGALLSEDTRIRGNAHLGLGNSLFQLGWMGLADSAYPADPAEIPDLDAFDAIARARIARMLDGPVPDEGETDGFVRIRDTILNWSDAARHYQSALDLNPGNQDALANRRTTMAFLERLRDLLEEERDDTAQSLPQPSPEESGDPDSEPGEGESQPGEEPEPGEEGEEGDAGEPGEEGQPGEEGENENPEGEGEGEEGEPSEGEGESENESDGPGEEPPGDQEPTPGDSDTNPGDPNESPEERARRILSENADVETGPLNPGRRMFLPPEKDW